MTLLAASDPIPATPRSAATKPNVNRRQDIDRAKGLGMLLVVFGHLVAKQHPSGNAWFGFLQTAVYQFHMPFFMYLSGYVVFLRGSTAVLSQRWRGLLRSRAERLLVPFFAFAVLLTAGKALASHFLSVDHPPGSVATSLYELFWDTDHSPAISVWYIGVLFVYVVLTPPLLAIVRGRLQILLAIALILHFVPTPHVMFLDRMSEYYVFFVAGAAAACAGSRWLSLIDRLALPALVLLLISVVGAVVFFDSVPGPVRLLTCGLLSIPALHGITRTTALSRSAVLLWVGTYSFVIYLFNTPFIGLAKGLLLKVMPWDGLNFLLFLPVLLVAGVVGPVLLKQWVLVRFPRLDRLTD